MAKVHDSATDLITFARGSSATYTGSDGTQQTAASDEPRIEYAADGSLKGLLIEEQRTNLLLNSDNPDTQVATLAAGSHTLSFVGGPSVTGIDDTITANAVDVFVYDTSKDSDGGAWRTGSLAQASSWYAEASSASRDPDTRSTRAEFPAVAVIVAESNKVTIYDGDDPCLPMWMVFTGHSTGFVGDGFPCPASSCVALNSEIVVGVFTTSSAGFGGTISFRFAADETIKSRGGYNSNYGRKNGIIAGNWGGLAAYQVPPLYYLVNGTVNDVAMTVLPGAPTDPATGLPVPTIAVATDGGVSVIKDDGTVVDSANTNSVYRVQFADTSLVWCPTSTPHGWFITDDVDSLTDGFSHTENLRREDTSTGNYPQTIQAITTNVRYEFLGSNVFAMSNQKASAPNSNGFYLYQRGEAVSVSQNKGMIAKIQSTYNTGWMNGDIKLAALANSATADRSVNNTPLTQNGTITAAPVETGADLVAYSGFSSSNYLEQPYNPDLDFGTGDFCVMGWVKQSSISASQIILAKANAAATSVFSFFTSASTGYLGYFHPTSGSVSSSKALALNAWNHIGLVRSIGLVTFYVNGVAVYSSTPTAFDLTRTNDDILRVGKDFSVNTASTSSMSLLRISATAPTADQIAKIYNDEKVLFQENAKATLTGSSDAVTALAHDPDTNLLHVGTSGGRSVFYGLRRVNETATAVTTAISAVDGLIVEQ